VAGKHIYDAIALTKNLNSKSGEIVRTVLEAARKNGLNQGYSEDRFFVKTAITNRKLKGKKIDIKGRGKNGIIQGTSSTCRIWMEEKNPADYYKMMLLGKAPTGIGWMMRRVLYQNKLGFHDVKALSHMTTSQGRRYRRVQFMRLVSKIQKQYSARGVRMHRHKIERNVANKLVRDAVKEIATSNEINALNQNSARQAHFEKEYKKIK
jgi:hypothetical protein